MVLAEESLPYSLYLCDAQPIVYEGLLRVLEGHPDFHVAGHSLGITEALATIAAAKPDIVVIGQSNPPRPLLPQVPQVLAESPRSRVVLWVLESAEQETFRALHGGARAVVSKTAPVERFRECLRTVAAGNIWLEDQGSEPSGLQPVNSMVRITPREREIINLICQGLKNREIAEILHITPGTVKVHLMHIFEKTGTKDRFQLALRARQNMAAAEQSGIDAVETIANGI